MDANIKKTWKWEHKPNRIPQLDYEDILTIIYLVERHGKKEIPIFSKRIMKKIDESMSVYNAEKNLIKKSEAVENVFNGFKPIVTWPKETEYLSSWQPF